MNSKIKLSIVTICRNNPFDVIKTSFSIRNIRKKSSIEWVVIDGSTNNDIEKLLSGISEQINYTHESDDGIYDAFNKGVNKSRGNYILFLNSGDSINENEFIEIFDEFNTNNLDMLFFGSNTFYENIKFRTITPRKLKPNFHSLPCSHQSMVFRRDLLRKFQFSPGFKIAGDLENFMNIVHTKNINNLSTKSINKAIVNFSIGGISTKKPILLLWEIFLILKKYEKSKMMVLLKTLRNGLGIFMGLIVPFHFYKIRRYVFINSKKYFKRLTLFLFKKGSLNEKIIVASNGRAGSTMLFLEIQKSFIKNNIFFKKIFLRFFKNKSYIEGPFGEFVADIDDIDYAKLPIIKTHSSPPKKIDKSTKYIYVYSDPLTSSISVYNRVLKEGIDFYISHLRHLNSIGLFEKIFEEDTLNYEEQLTEWKSISNPNLYFVKLPEIWSKQKEIESFLGLEINLPPIREPSKLKHQPYIDNVLYNELKKLY